MEETPKVPNSSWVNEQVARGLTQQEIADAWFKKSGVRVSRTSIAMVIHRGEIEEADGRRKRG